MTVRHGQDIVDVPSAGQVASYSDAEVECWAMVPPLVQRFSGVRILKANFRMAGPFTRETTLQVP